MILNVVGVLVVKVDAVAVEGQGRVSEELDRRRVHLHRHVRLSPRYFFRSVRKHRKVDDQSLISIQQQRDKVEQTRENKEKKNSRLTSFGLTGPPSLSFSI